MLKGGHIGEYAILTKIGQGAYGQIFTVRSTKTNQLFAAKVEPMYVPHKTVDFESKVLQTLQPSQYFPRIVKSGHNAHFSYLIMDLFGPSLASCVHRLPDRHLSLSTGLRVALHLLRALEVMHRAGLVHRDIKPSNVLIRENCREFPIALIDFGLSRYYLDRTTHQHLPPRPRPGFRGTSLYASVNAHMEMDLSRRDDLISWYYVVVDLLTGDLPWKRVSDRGEIMEIKKTAPITAAIQQIAPGMGEVWRMVNSLEYRETPDYQGIYEVLERVISDAAIEMDAEYDWDVWKHMKKSTSMTESSGYTQNSFDGSSRAAGEDSVYDRSHDDGCCLVC